MLLEIKFTNINYDLEEFSEALWFAGAYSTSFVDSQDDPIYEPELNTTPFWENTEITALFGMTDETKEIIKELEGLGYTDFEYTASRVEEQNWTNVWMDEFKPMKFGNRLWIFPSWVDPVDYAKTNSEFDLAKSVVVNLDPGLAFGTGTHPTTRLCLEWLDAQDLTGKSVIDYGCGSGILAVAALKLGAKSVLAIDIDPQAIQATYHNADENGVRMGIKALLADQILKLDSVDLVVSNILAGPLVELAPQLTDLVKPQGLICLSGILEEKGAAVKQAYQNSFDLKLDQDQEWIRLAGKKLV